MDAPIDSVPPRIPAPDMSAAAYRWSLRLLVAAAWASGAIFGAYILAFFGGTALSGDAARWNESLPGLHDAAAPAAAVAIGLHFITGGVLLVLGPLQLFSSIRRRVPAFHRWLGRVYIVSAGLAGVGGLAFIAAKGTIGGSVMNAGFGLYGALMVVCAALAHHHARGRRFAAHRAWAIRLFALTIGSWLYRMEYGFWFLVADQAGHTDDFRGWFDAVMVFFFYLPNLVVAEIAIRAGRAEPAGPIALPATAAMLGAAGFVLLATWVFTTDYWAPGIVSGLTGAPL